jgi:hypothetical protein
VKVEFKGSKTVVVTMTVNQLSTLQAALDSCCEAHAYRVTGSTYADVPKVEAALCKAIHRSRGES